MSDIEIYALLFFLVLAFSFVVVLCFATIVYVIAIWKKNNSIMDVAYGLAFVLLVIFSLSLYSFKEFLSDPQELRVLVVAAMVIVWGLRLSIRIYRRNREKPEDFRYAKWRSEWKWFKLRSYFQIYVLQSFIIAIVATPFVSLFTFTGVNQYPSLFWAGFCLWVVGFFFESVGDAQLDRFLKQKERTSQIMTTGLWKYSRHPNYFGEATMWWGIWIVSLSTLLPLWYLTVCSPVLITFLLLKVSGVPMLEKRWQGIPEWEAYKSRTSAFFPFPPRER